MHTRFALATLSLALAIGCAQAPLPDLGKAPGFALTSQEGVPFSSEELAGKVWVTYFFFTSCAGPCPVLTKEMGELAAAYPGEDALRFVSMSVDPETDTPARLREYAAEKKADLARWTFLTGPDAEMQRLAVEFKLGTFDEPMVHSNRFLLIDGSGTVRGSFNGLIDEDVAALHAAIGQLLAERH